MSDFGSTVLERWRRLAGLPGGRQLFNRMIGFAVPYTGTISPDVVSLRPGHAVVRMRDRRRVRNHLRSVHAIALTNLAELATSLAMTTAQPPDGRWIVTGMDIQFLKKARGAITAEAQVPALDFSQGGDAVGETALRDDDGDVVATARVHWRIGPKPPSSIAADETGTTA